MAIGDKYWAEFQSGKTLEAIASEAAVQPRSVKLAIRRAGHVLKPEKVQPEGGWHGFYITDRLSRAINKIGKDKLLQGLAILKKLPKMRSSEEPGLGEGKTTEFFLLTDEEKAELEVLAERWQYASVSALVRNVIECLILRHRVTDCYKPADWQEQPSSPWQLEEPTIKVSLRPPLVLWNQIQHLKRPRGYAHLEGLDISRFLRQAIDACFWDSLDRYKVEAPAFLKDRVTVRTQVMAQIFERQQADLDRARQRLGWSQQDTLNAVIQQAIALNRVPTFQPNPEFDQPSAAAQEYWEDYVELRSLREVAQRQNVSAIQVADTLAREGYILISEPEKTSLIEEAIAQ